jgi:hypothetical protein
LSRNDNLEKACPAPGSSRATWRVLDGGLAVTTVTIQALDDSKIVRVDWG